MIKFYSFNVDPRCLYRDNEQVLSIVKDSRVADSYILHKQAKIIPYKSGFTPLLTPSPLINVLRNLLERSPIKIKQTKDIPL